MIIDTRTGKVLVTNEELVKEVKGWIDSFTNEEWCRKLEEENTAYNLKGDT